MTSGFFIWHFLGKYYEGFLEKEFLILFHCILQFMHFKLEIQSKRRKLLLKASCHSESAE